MKVGRTCYNIAIGINDYTIKRVNASGSEIAFAPSDVVTSASSATGTIASLTNPEIAYYSGNTIYVEDRAPISRATDQTENIKLIVEF